MAHVTGMAAGYGAAVMLILMSRAPWLEHGIGADRLARWHAWAGPLVIMLHCGARPCRRGGLGGCQLARSDGSDEERAQPSWGDDRIGGHCDPRADRTCLATGCATTHLLRAMALPAPAHLSGCGAGFAHQLAGPDLAGRQWLQIAWALLYTYAYALVLRWRVLQPFFQLWRHRLRVEDVRQESADVMSVLMSGQSPG